MTMYRHHALALSALILMTVGFALCALAAGRRRARRLFGCAAMLGLASLLMAASIGPIRAPSPPRIEAGLDIGVKAADARALSTLMSYWDRRSVMWSLPGTSGWWTSANALTATIDAERAQGIHTYDAEIALTWAAYGGDFRNHYMDDTEWWGLAWLDAYQWTHDARYLATARLDADYATSSMSAGSIPWAAPMIKNYSQRNGITNALYVELSARLATVTGVAAYRTQAQTVQSWLSRTLTRGDGLLGDHPGNWTAWSYVQGADVAGLVALGDQVDATRLAHAAMTSPNLNTAGIATDPCEAADACRADGPAFKGAYARGLATLGTREVSSYLLRQADSMYQRDRMVGDFYGEFWSGPPDVSNSTRQQAALDLLTAALIG